MLRGTTRGCKGLEVRDERKEISLFPPRITAPYLSV